MPEIMQTIVQLVESHRCPLQDEKATQSELEAVFERAGLNALREHRLSLNDIPDFMVDGIVVEVKIKGQRAAIYRQLQRYSTHATVKGIVLATSRSMALPDSINGLPLRMASLSKAWL